MKPRHIKEYCDLFDASFLGVGDKLFSRYEYNPSSPPEQSTVEENTLNSEGFYYFSGETMEGVLRNHALASAVTVVWQSRLAATFPQREFRCFVSNEYDVWSDTKDPGVVVGDGVRTVLRLWSLPADSPSFDRVYRVHEVAPDRVLWPEYDDSRLVPLQEVFDVIHEAKHPAREQTLRRGRAT